MTETRDRRQETGDRSGNAPSAEAAPLHPVRVIHVIDDLGLGGAQRQLVELVKALPRDRYDLHVVSLSTTKTDYARTLQAAGVCLTQIPQSGKWDGRCFSMLSKLIKTGKPSIVHTWLFTADLYGRMAAWVAHVPVIISAVRSVEPDKPAHYVVVDRVLRNITSAFTVNARAIGEVLTAREHVPIGKIHTIYNGLDLRALDPSRVNGAIRRAIGVGADVPLVGIVGRLAPVKDHATFLRAAAHVHRDAPQARFLIVGNGPLRGALEQLSQSLGLSGVVRFLDSQADVAEVFAALDLAVVSSRYEGCSNVILEAMAMGKPVIATAVGGNPELVTPGRTGLLVPVGDADRLAEAILTLVRDRPSARAMGQAGRQRIEAEFTLERMMRQTEQLYRQLMAGTGGR